MPSQEAQRGETEDESEVRNDIRIIRKYRAVSETPGCSDSPENSELRGENVSRHISRVFQDT